MGRRPGSRNRGAVLAGQDAPKLSLRLTPEQLAEVRAHGGSAWARKVILDTLDRAKNIALTKANNEGWDWADGDGSDEWRMHLAEVDGRFYLVEAGGTEPTSVTPLGHDREAAKVALNARIAEAEAALE